VKRAAHGLVLVGLCLIFGCQRSLVHTASPSTSLEQLLLQWRADGDEAELVDAFIALARTAPSNAQLRAFDLSEAQYRSLDEAGRTVKLENYLSIQGTLRGMVRAAIERARAQAASGDQQSALKTLDAVDRIAEANNGDDVVAIGRLVAQAIQHSVADARASLVEALDSRP